MQVLKKIVMNNLPHGWLVSQPPSKGSLPT